MSGNLLPAAATPVVAGLPNWFAKASQTAESGFNGNTICFWGNSTTSNALDLFGGGAQPVCAPSFGTCRLGNLHQKAGEPLANTRILNFGNNGSTLAAALADARCTASPGCCRRASRSSFRRASCRPSAKP